MLRFATALIITATIVIGGVAVPAEAADGPGGEVITYSVKVNYPYNSGEVFGTVNVTADVLCSAPVAGLDVYVSLQKNGATTATGRSQNGGQNYLSANAAVGCVDGKYQGVGHISATFPAGFSPSVTGTDAASVLRDINCLVAGVRDDESTQADTVTVTARRLH
ncbi:hypothetical protein C5B96_03710 [Subtercola sp. Z020]|uniref:hypothetical protein n=1 Tax=Subtercola sp. Z020 TaxID=2080582 RepID=UPI000CE8F459|nr:hypothetical protein [Subtercola sp. Z020]PPF87820.1 hypothetical protein C5B96_03710 [Subtercola sp. Z020]